MKRRNRFSFLLLLPFLCLMALLLTAIGNVLVQTYLAYTSPDLLQRPYAMAMNMVTLLLSVGMGLVYAFLMRALLRRTGGAA